MKKTLLLIALLGTLNAQASSVLCTQKGGKSLEVTVGNSTLDLCALGKARIASSTLAEELHGDRTAAVKAILKNKVFYQRPTSGKRIPEDKQLTVAEYNCKGHGGKLLAYQGEGRGTLCRFKDQSAVDIHTLYEGTNKPNHKLLKVLGH
jgi:hypothetical protein